MSEARALVVVGPEQGALSAEERERLAELEGTLERAKLVFVAIGEALGEIRDSRLYRETHSSFDAYTHERWGMRDGVAIRLIGAARVHLYLASATSAEPPGRTVAADLAPLFRTSPERAAALWEQLSEQGEPTRRVVTAAVREALGTPASSGACAGFVGLVVALNQFSDGPAALAAGVDPRMRSKTARAIRRAQRYMGEVARHIEKEDEA
jgi:hypothetical protein